VRDGGHAYRALFICSVSVPGYTLLNNTRYPGIIQDYAYTFRTLKRMRCDVPLGPHGSFFHLTEKRALAAAKPARNPFVDPAGCREWIRSGERAFRAQLERERSGAAK
jgi:metallo-beta-lactamase class B